MNSNLDHELYEKARKRTKQKKRLYFHFVFFLVGSVFLVVLNKVVKFHEEIDWYVWGVLVWLFFLVTHAIRVLVMNRFFDKDWERVQTEKLIQKHEKKLAELEKKLTKKGIIAPTEESESNS